MTSQDREHHRKEKAFYLDAFSGTFSCFLNKRLCIFIFSPVNYVANPDSPILKHRTVV